MAVDHVKSTFVTNLDATPAAMNTAGEGGMGRLMAIEGYATAVASGTAASTYQLVRVPSNCKIKTVVFESAAQTAGTFDVGCFYATDGAAGKPTALLLADVIPSAADFFASAIVCANAVARTDITNESGNYTIEKRCQPLWQALALTSDPGGNIDIVATVKTTDITTGTGRFGISVTYVE